MFLYSITFKTGRGERFVEEKEVNTVCSLYTYIVFIVCEYFCECGGSQRPFHPMELFKDGEDFKSEDNSKLYMESNNSKEEDPMRNQICRVCDEPAAGYHFGAFTCEGCKSFFGRTCGKTNLNSISECKNNYTCVIDKKNRTSCKACRLRKCLRVGMSKAGSRYGRRSNWFKMHCVLSNPPSSKARGGVEALKKRGEAAPKTAATEVISSLSAQFPWWYFVLQRQFLASYESSLKKLNHEDGPIDLSRRS